MRETIKRHLTEATTSLQAMNDSHVGVLQAAAELLVDCFRRGGAVYVCGNGGSAADAQHIAAELAGRFLCERKALACSALSTNTSTMTAVANDYTYDIVFARQVQAHMRAGDVLWVLSTSGKSPSITRAVQAARDLGASILSFTGGAGGELPPLSTVCFVAPAATSYAIQQLHQVAYHAICDIVEQRCGETR